MRLVQPPMREYRTWTSDSRTWARYVPRRSDIVIATYPKSGTTWMQRIVGGLVFLTAEPMPFSSEISMWIDGRTTKSVETTLATVQAQTHRRFLKAHLPLDGLPIYDDVKYIHVARDGRDVLMSWHHHDNAWKPEMLERLDAIGLGDDGIGRPYPRPPPDPAEAFRRWLGEGAVAGHADGSPNSSWFEFERSWWEARHWPNVLMVHYNDLKADLAGQITRIAAFLDIVVPADLLPQLAEAAGFAAMRRDGGALLPHQVGIFREAHRSFLNKGTNGRWREVFRDEDLARYAAMLAASVPPDCAAWLELGGAIPPEQGISPGPGGPAEEGTDPHARPSSP